MALSDLLWACPACGEDRGLSGDDDLCSACGTQFIRRERAAIAAVAPDGSETVGSARYWLDRLPDPASLLDQDPIRSARVLIRAVTGEATVEGESGYLNRIELFGDDVPGTLSLERDRLIVLREGGEAEPWPLQSLTAVQTSSKTLQLKRRHRPLVAFRFQNDAIYLWEQLVRAALRDFYGRTGRGVITEFQPRIVTR